MPIAPIAPALPAAPAVTAGQPGPKASGAGFGGVLAHAVAGLNALQQAADTAATQLASGKAADLATAVVAAEKANLGLQLAVQVRNRAISAYQQIMTMQI